MLNLPRTTWLNLIGAAFFVYALLGNYVALPGYIRFLERGGTSEAGASFDFAVLVGASKTILWMYSFQLGVLCLALSSAIRNDLNTRLILIAGIAWLALWSWPSLPAPGAWFYILFGTILLLCIGLVFADRGTGTVTRHSRTAGLGAMVFFAFATWEVCGLGSTGRILHPEETANPIAHNLVVTQSSKLMIEFVLAWSFLVLSRSRGIGADD
jgi:hypothetical protein